MTRTLYSSGPLATEFLTFVGKSQDDIDDAARRMTKRTGGCVAVLVRVGTFHGGCDEGDGYTPETIEVDTLIVVGGGS